MSYALELSSADVRSLATQVMGAPCHFIHNTETKPFSGVANIVYALETSHKKRVSIRIPKDTASTAAHLFLEQEAECRQRIDTEKLQIFQPMYSFSITPENPIGAPFMVLGWAEGVTLSWSDTHPVGPQREGVLRSVANASLDLISVQETSKF